MAVSVAIRSSSSTLVSVRVAGFRERPAEVAEQQVLGLGVAHGPVGQPVEVGARGPEHPFQRGGGFVAVVDRVGHIAESISPAATAHRLPYARTGLECQGSSRIGARIAGWMSLVRSPAWSSR
ncbi:hypothetical protein ACU686_22240 [Yinghuangia aomiensis]